MVTVCVVMLILVALTVLLSLKVTIEVGVSKNHNNRLKKELKIAVANHPIDISKYLSKKDKTVRKDKNPDEKKESTEKEDRFLEKISKLRTNIARGKYTYLLSKRYVRKKIFLENFDLSITFGLDDAAHTGIAAGAVWGSIYNIFGFVDSLFTVKSHKFDVNPIFEGEYFEFDFATTAKTRILNIFLILFAVFVNYIKTGKNL